MLNSALIISALGMAWVFLFLGILILTMMALAALITRFAPPVPLETEKAGSSSKGKASVIAILKARGFLGTDNTKKKR